MTIGYPKKGYYIKTTIDQSLMEVERMQQKYPEETFYVVHEYSGNVIITNNPYYKGYLVSEYIPLKEKRRIRDV